MLGLKLTQYSEQCYRIDSIRFRLWKFFNEFKAFNHRPTGIIFIGFWLNFKVVFLKFLFPMLFQKPIQKFGMGVGEVWQLKFQRKKKWKNCLKITICMNVSRFMNLAAIFSLHLESQFKNIIDLQCREAGHDINLQVIYVCCTNKASNKSYRDK